MKPTAPPGCNMNLGRPMNWDEARDGPCDSLPALKARDEHGNQIIQTAWVPTLEELTALNAGAQVVLTVWGFAHPPVSIDVTPAPEKQS